MKNQVLTLKQWRKLKDLSQEELASASGLSSKSISNYEKSETALQNAQYRTIKKIAKALDVNVSNIFLGDTSEKPEYEEVK